MLGAEQCLQIGLIEIEQTGCRLHAHIEELLPHQVAPALEQPLATGDGLLQPQPDPGGVTRMDRVIRARRFGQITAASSFFCRKMTDTNYDEKTSRVRWNARAPRKESVLEIEGVRSG